MRLCKLNLIHIFWTLFLETQSHSKLHSFGSYILSTPSSARSTKLRSRNWTSMRPLGLGSSTRNFDLLKCSVMVSVRLQRKVSWPWGRTPLFEGQTFRMKEKGVPQILKLPQVSFRIFGILEIGWQEKCSFKLLDCLRSVSGVCENNSSTQHVWTSY